MINALTNALTHHVRDVHDKIKDFKFKLGYKSFSSKDGIQKHVMAIHCKTRDYKLKLHIIIS